MDLAQSFDLTDGWNVTRILCGLFLIPHLFVKFRNKDFVKGFMEKAGLRPPMAWVYTALVVEVVAAIGLIFDVMTMYAAILAGVFLVIAAWASWRVSGGKWMWNFGGAEYALFWGLICFAVALDA